MVLDGVLSIVNVANYLKRVIATDAPIRFVQGCGRLRRFAEHC